MVKGGEEESGKEGQERGESKIKGIEKRGEEGRGTEGRQERYVRNGRKTEVVKGKKEERGKGERWKEEQESKGYKREDRKRR